MALAHADRSRIIPNEPPRTRWFAGEGLLVGTVLIDGFINGRWKVELEGRSRAILVIEPFVRLCKQDRTALTEEGARLLAFAASDLAARDVRIRPHEQLEREG